MNLEEIGLLTHNAENLLDLARKGSLPLTGNNADAVFKSIDMLKQMVMALREAIEADGTVPAQAGLQELAEYLRQCAEGELAESAPVADVHEATPAEEIPDPVPEGDFSDEQIEEIIQGAGSTLSNPPEAAPAPAAPEAGPVAARKSGSIIEEKIKVSTGRLDNLVNMVGELVIAQLMVSESLRKDDNSDNELLRNTAHQGKIIRELQELAMSMRMVPISGVFQKMARIDTRPFPSGRQTDQPADGRGTDRTRPNHCRQNWPTRWSIWSATRLTMELKVNKIVLLRQTPQGHDHAQGVPFRRLHCDRNQ